MENKEIPKYVGEKIRYFRTKRNITQQELADYLNTTSQTISRYENGVLEANQTVLFSLADYFGISINDFFPNTITETQEEKYKQLLKSKGLMDDNDNIDEESLNKLLKIADMIKNYEKED